MYNSQPTSYRVSVNYVLMALLRGTRATLYLVRKRLVSRCRVQLLDVPRVSREIGKRR